MLITALARRSNLVARAAAEHEPSLRHVTLHLENLPPAWDGLVVAQVSDVHAGWRMGVARLRRLRSLIASAGAQLVVFTGDQVDRRPMDAELFARGMRGVAAPLGVYGILGNHDHYIDPERSEWALASAGVRPLVNCGVVLERGDARLALVGVDDLVASRGRGPDFGVLAEFPGCFRLCLSHQPQTWTLAAAHGAHLTLAGHTHGGQIALPSRTVNVARFHTRYIAGPYRRDDSILYVSRGVGVGAVPVRLRCPAEVDVLTLRRARHAAASKSRAA